jgi:hypothetical protein
MNCFEIKNENDNNKKVIEASCLKYVWPLDIYSINEKQYGMVFLLLNKFRALLKIKFPYPKN